MWWWCKQCCRILTIIFGVERYASPFSISLKEVLSPVPSKNSTPRIEFRRREVYVAFGVQQRMSQPRKNANAHVVFMHTWNISWHTSLLCVDWLRPHYLFLGFVQLNTLNPAIAISRSLLKLKSSLQLRSYTTPFSRATKNKTKILQYDGTRLTIPWRKWQWFTQSHT